MPIIGSGLKTLLLEAFAAAVGILPPALRENFVLIGGTSMLALGGMRETLDVDIVVTAKALNAFCEAAALDSRFSQDTMNSWYYTSATPGIENLSTSFEFLAMGGGFAPMIRAARPVLGGFRAGLAELILMKAKALDSRGEDKDRDDLHFLLDKMEASEESFAGVEMEDEDLEVLKVSVRGLGGQYSVLLRNFLQRP
ncbi:hypothetical protein GP486_001247 [Trichoglossum hirsutum]|uniref:Nucleotidyl transferase AbiEii toxin, Type IV TA system n=1 Tax=Trichoglossum hirsutum TaxID=265104 RepID=A0A9P8LH78_9PEZI|nr:hypothetical protein GP486_001247 [Trichoglossum hirsutum]